MCNSYIYELIHKHTNFWFFISCYFIFCMLYNALEYLQRKKPNQFCPRIISAHCPRFQYYMAAAVLSLCVCKWSSSISIIYWHLILGNTSISLPPPLSQPNFYLTQQATGKHFWVNLITLLRLKLVLFLENVPPT